MSTLIAIVTLLCVFKYLLKLAGDDVVSKLIYYKVYLKISKNKDLVKYHNKRAEFQQTHKEKLSISAQDQFAKWTKLNRKCDKLKKEMGELQQLVLDGETQFLKNCSFALKFFNYAPLLFIRVWYRKSAMLVLPKGMFPWAVELYLSFPSVARGCISLGGWVFVVNSVLNGIGFIVKTLVFAQEVKPANVEAHGADPAAVVGEHKIVEIQEDEPKIEAVE